MRPYSPSTIVIELNVRLCRCVPAESICAGLTEYDWASDTDRCRMVVASAMRSRCWGPYVERSSQTAAGRRPFGRVVSVSGSQVTASWPGAGRPARTADGRSVRQDQDRQGASGRRDYRRLCPNLAAGLQGARGTAKRRSWARLSCAAEDRRASESVADYPTIDDAAAHHQ